MAAGLGFKTFTTGEVLTAADVNGYLMQGVLVFATEAARNSAITSPQEGQFAFTKDTNSLWYYSGSAWVASGATGDIEGVTAGVGISGGGTSGTVTITNSMATAIDAKGDLVAGTGADTFARLAVGANDTVLTADSSTSTGLKWAAPAGGGGMTVLASGSLTGATVSITSISGAYNDLVLVLRDFYPSGDAQLEYTINSSTGIYGSNSSSLAGNFGAPGSAGQTATNARITDSPVDATQGDNFSVTTFYDYANTDTKKIALTNVMFLDDNGFNRYLKSQINFLVTTSAISSISLFYTAVPSATHSAGSYILYGVK
jgi:hypothetical protein